MKLLTLGDMNEIPLANSKLGSWLNNDNVTTYMKVGILLVHFLN